MTRKRILRDRGPLLAWPESRAIGRNVRALRARHGWTLAKLAAELGCATSGLSRTESGERRFRQGEVTALTRLFGVTREQLAAACQGCHGEPPAGFACLACGAEG